MTGAYLWLNAILYAVFALMCTFNPRGTSKAIGYALPGGSGMSEYLTVYGGLQVGLAVFFGWLAMRPDMHRAGLVLALALYVPIVVFRWASVAKSWPVERMTLAVGALEAGLLLFAILLFVRSG